MKKSLAITLTVDAKTGEVTAVRNSFEDLDRQVNDTNKGLAGMMPKLLAIAGMAGTIYGLAKAFSFVVRSGFDYNKQMDASTAKLTAMISASKGYTTVAGEQVTALQRQKLISQETAYMMQILKQTNAETAMGMNELVDIYALAKPGMDRYHWAVKDQIAIVKLASNTASNFGMTAEELSTGIDDLAAGTWEASSGFGKMMKSLGVSKKEYQAAADKVAYLKEKMKETGAAQDTWAVATSNFQVAWDNMAGQVTQPIFDGVKEAIKYVTKQMNTYGPDSMQVFSDALVGMVNGAISAVGTLIGWISKLVSGFRIAYAGYKKLAGAARAWWNNDNAENSAKLQALQAEQDRLKSLGRSYGVVRAKIRAIKKDMQGYDAGIKMWKEADKDLADIATFDSKMQGIASTVKQIHIKKGIVNPISEAVTPTTQLAYKIGKVADNTKKSTAATKSHVQSLKAQAQEATQALNSQKQLNREYLRLTHDKSGLFQLDVEETMQKFIDSGEYSAEQLSKIYDGMWEDYEGKAKEASFNVHTWLKEAFDIDSDSIFGKLFDDFQGMFDGFVTVLKSDKGINGALAEMDLGVQAANMLQQSGDPTMAAIGYGLEAVGALLSNTLSEAEIERARGRSEFESKSLITMRELAEKNPLLPLNVKMLTHLSSMDNHFNAIASAISSSTNGLDLNGSEFQSTASYGFLGFSSSESELLGAGIAFGKQTVAGFLEGVDAIGYEAVKVTSSSFWGLVKSEKIQETAKDLPQSLKDDISQAFGDGIQAVMEAVDVLGFDTTAIQAKLDQYVLDLGKLNFKDLDATEQAEALNNAMSEQLDGAFKDAISSIASPENVAALNSLSHAGESYTETLVRAAASHETVRIQLALFGQTATDFVGSNVLVDAAGGLEAFQSAMSIFTSNFFSGPEQQEMQRLQLEMALQTHNVALPASKAQFKALVLETQQKILSVQANISAMKAEIIAKKAGSEAGVEAALSELVAKGRIAQGQADVIKGQVSSNNMLIESSQEAGKAAVGFGKSVYTAINSMVTGAGEAVTEGAQTAANGVDVDWDSITSPAIAAAEAELSNLEGLYGTLMSNMGTFADYYGGVESAAETATEALNDLEKSLVAIANLKAVWGEDDISAKKIILDATKRATGMTDLTYDNFLERFEAATANGLGMEDDTLKAWQDMSTALRNYQDALEQKTEEEKSAVKTDIDFYTNLLQTIRDTYSGNLSYLNSVEKASYLERIASVYQDEGDSANYIKTLQTQLEYDKRLSVTKEAYASKFDLYVEKLQEQEPEATTTDVVEELSKLRDDLEDIKYIVEQSSYQKASA